MKYLKNVFFLLLMLVVLNFSVSCGLFSPILSNDLSRYGEWDPMVKEILEESFPGFLPEEEVAKSSGVFYEYYYYPPPLLGDESFYIFLTLEGKDVLEYETERLHLSEHTGKEVSRGQLYYLIRGDEKVFDYYMDKKSVTALPFYFSVVLVEKESNRITFLAADVWDEQAPVQPVIDFLGQT